MDNAAAARGEALCRRFFGGNMELLSPAGNREALVAAVNCGADAVYLGYTAFGARSYAGNFNDQELLEAVEFAHERGKKIFVTVNTLVKQCEMDDLCDVLELLCRTHVDAAIVQDMGVARIAREQFPQLALHASTQMTIHNAQGAEFMKNLGFTRVVPARECSLPELRKMADTGVEIEAFAHGALCVGVSGQCLFSSMIGGRSGNRGRCAQPCRLPYQLEDGTSGYLLSTRDLMLIGHLPELRDVGVYSFKLEGRMKRPEYVGVVTKAYREALDAAQAHVPYTPSEATIKALRQIFNRGGFTEGYAMGKSNAALMSWERPNHWGLPIGRVTSVRGPLARVQLTDDLHDGDGLQIRGKKEAEVTYSGNDTACGKEAIVRIPAAGVQAGDAVFRLTDAIQMREIREMMNRTPVFVPLKGRLTAIPGKLPEFELTDDQGRTVRVRGNSAVDAAQQRALTEESAGKQLGKMGGTPYILTSLRLIGENAFMTAGALNALRRDALEAMRRERIACSPSETEPLSITCNMPEQERMLVVQGERLCDAQVLLDCGADQFVWMPQTCTPEALQHELTRNTGIKPILALPAVVLTDELDHLHRFVCGNAALLGGIVANNQGQLAYSWPLPVYGGQGLNVTNGDCARFYYAHGIKRLTVSCELSLKEIKELMSCGGNYEIEAYGKTQLMLLSHCPRRNKAGDEHQDAACQACAAHGGIPAVYTDRKGYRFTAKRLRMEHGCVLRLYNSVTTDMARSAGKLHELGCSLRVCFTDEPLDIQKEIVSSYRSILDRGIALHSMEENVTSGHLLRGVE